jgi:hypothetical protein
MNYWRMGILLVSFPASAAVEPLLAGYATSAIMTERIDVVAYQAFLHCPRKVKKNSLINQSINF